MTLRLRRQVLRARRTHVWTVALASGLALNGLLFALTLTEEPRTPTVVIVEPEAPIAETGPPACTPTSGASDAPGMRRCSAPTSRS